MTYEEVLKETNEFYSWVQSLNYSSHSTILNGAIVMDFPNYTTLSCVLEEILNSKWGNKLLWKSFTRTRMVVYHKEL